MSRTVVGVLRGGPSSEHALSLRTGSAVLESLPEESFDSKDIYIDKRGVWHLRGVPMSPARALKQIDVVINALHGGVGEDGTVARVLKQCGIPFTGSDALGSHRAFSKIRARESFGHAGLLMPKALIFTGNDDLNSGQMARLVFDVFGPPYMLKPPTEGASSGIRVARTILDLPDAIADVLEQYGSVIIEEFVVGINATVGVIEHYRGEDLYALPPARIELPDMAPHILHEHHHTATLKYFVPSDFSHAEKIALVEAAKRAHRALGLEHFSRSDFILTPRGPYILETNAIPGLYAGSALPPMLESVGASTRQFVSHALELAQR